MGRPRERFAAWVRSLPEPGSDLSRAQEQAVPFRLKLAGEVSLLVQVPWKPIDKIGRAHV